MKFTQISKTASNVNFSISDAVLVEIYQNDELQSTITEGFDNINYVPINGINVINIKAIDVSDGVEYFYVILDNNIGRVYFYKEGNQCETITGGWSISGSSSFQENYIDVRSATGNPTYISSSSITTTNSLDMSGFVNLVFDLTPTQLGSGMGTYRENTNKFGIGTNTTFMKLGDPSSRSEYSIPLDNENDKILMSATSYETTTYYKTFLTYNAHIVYATIEDPVAFENNNDYIKITVKNNSFAVISEISVYQDNKLMLTDDSGDNVVLFNNDVLGNSEITVVVKYDQGDGIINVVSVTEICFKDPTLESMVILPHLPLNSTLSDVIVRLNEVDLLTEVIRNNMRDLLLANDIDVSEGARLSDMVRLIEGLTISNDEAITDYINQINVLENQVNDLNTEITTAKSKIVPENIKAGVEIFDIVGTAVTTNSTSKILHAQIGGVGTVTYTTPIKTTIKVNMVFRGTGQYGYKVKIEGYVNDVLKHEATSGVFQYFGNSMSFTLAVNAGDTIKITNTTSWQGSEDTYGQCVGCIITHS